MEVDIDSPYDVLGVNHNMSDVNIKKRYGNGILYDVQATCIFANLYSC